MNFYDNKPRNREPREMYDIVCTDCGTDAQVPFKPDPDRPVYCRDCLQNHRPKRNFY